VVNKMKNKLSVKKIAIIAIFISLALILSYVDSLIPLTIMVPGIKIGLANVVIIFSLYMLGFNTALFISIIRVILSSVLFGSILTFAYSMTGAMLSILVMVILKNKVKLSTLTISIIGAVMHNIGQILMAIILMNTKEIIYYLPILMITGMISGTIIGIISALLIKFFKKNKIVDWWYNDET
jgi:heptaprenyl diphosphate synthase component I